jgi:signal peptidase
MRKATKLAGTALQGVVVAVALSAAMIFVLPRLLGWQTVTVMSGSMAPAYAVDAVLAIDPVDPAHIKPGDVIAFQTESDRPMVTHRVVAVNSDPGGLAFVTKGDANEEADSNTVPASAIRGRVVFGVPYVGSFVRAVHNPVGFAALIIVPGIVLIGQEILSIRRGRRKERASWLEGPPPLATDAVAAPDELDTYGSAASENCDHDELEHEIEVHV